MLDAAWLSIRIAMVSACGAVVLGTLAGMALARFGAFRGRALLVGMTTAPLVMPEVITGLSLLLLFVALEQAHRLAARMGALTITLAHITFCMAYVDGGGTVAPGRIRRVARGGGDGSGRAPAEGVLAHHAAADRAGAAVRDGCSRSRSPGMIW